MKLNRECRSSIFAHDRQIPAKRCHRFRCSHQQRSSSLFGVLAIAKSHAREKARGKSVEAEEKTRLLVPAGGLSLYQNWCRRSDSNRHGVAPTGF